MWIAGARSGVVLEPNLGVYGSRVNVKEFAAKSTSPFVHAYVGTQFDNVPLLVLADNLIKNQSVGGFSFHRFQ